MQTTNLYKHIQIINSLSKFDWERRYIATWSLEWSKINFDSAEKITYNDRPSRASQQAESWDLIFAKMQWTDKTLIIDDESRDYIYSSWFFILRADENLDKNYLYQFLRSKSFHEQKDKLCTWATQKALTLEWLKQIEIHLPPLATQRAIADKLDKLQSLIDLKKQAITKTDELAKSIFLEMFGDPMMNEKRWEIEKIGDLLDSANYWTSQKANENWEWMEILRMNNITYSWWRNLTDMKHIVFEWKKDDEKYTVRKWDILFNRTNSKELVGKTALYIFHEPRAFAGYLIRLRTNLQIANPQYIVSFLNSNFGKSTLFFMAKNIVGMANINAQEVQNIKIPLPPLSLQQKFADIITKLQATSDEHKQALAKLEELYQAEMQKSFSL